MTVPGKPDAPAAPFFLSHATNHGMKLGKYPSMVVQSFILVTVHLLIASWLTQLFFLALPCDMDNSPTLIYLLEQQLRLCPEISNCSGCGNVEYIYFTGVVCHAVKPDIDVNGRCLTHANDIP